MTALLLSSGLQDGRRVGAHDIALLWCSPPSSPSLRPSPVLKGGGGNGRSRPPAHVRATPGGSPAQALLHCSSRELPLRQPGLPTLLRVNRPVSMLSPYNESA